MTETETVVGLLLENMLQLINSELILKAFEEKVVIEKEQIERVYEDMQFLQKFLKDLKEKRDDENEELKSIVAKIRDISYRAEDILDWFVLNVVLQQRDGSITDDFPLYFTSSHSIVHLARKFSDCLTGIGSIEEGEKAMMEILSWLKSHMADKIHHRYRGVVKEIKTTIKEVMEIHREILGLSPHKLSKGTDDLHSLSRRVLYQAGIILNCFESATRDFSRFEAGAAGVRVHLQGLRLLRPQFCSSSDYYPLFNMFKNMADQTREICDVIAGVTEKIGLINAEVIKIYDKGLSVTRLDSFTTNQFSLLLDLSRKMVNQAKENFHSISVVIEETKPIKIEAMEISQKGSRLSWLESLIADQIRKGFDIVTKEIKSIKREVMQIYKKKMYGVGATQVRESSHGASSKPASSIVKEEIIVGFDDEATTIMELLVGEQQKKLKVIPIIGMPGLGKTTLAMKVYKDPFIEHHFHIRAWTSVSQVYRKIDLLLNILSSADIQLKVEIDRKSDKEFGEVLYKSLKGKKYLIVLDDIWESGALDDLKIYFPNDNNGSRILFTSRHVDVAVALHAEPHYLRFLNPDESWDLLRQKAFQGGRYPQELEEIGQHIAKKCQGLPLAILVIAGLLAKKDNTQHWWRRVAHSVSSYIITDPEQYMDTLALSYDHLPHHLKPCFLYFGAFPEDSEISVWKLILLWVAEGFIPRNQQKSLEEVAEDYLMDLIDRSLVVVSKKRSNGEIKACRVHDLLHDLCLRKAREENLLCIFRGMDQNDFFNTKMSRRICINADIKYFDHHKFENYVYSNDVPEIRSFHSTKMLPQFFVSSFCGAFKLLRVLNVSSVIISFFPEELQLLVHLRYVSFRVTEHYFQPSISKLCRLETFIVEGGSTGRLSFSYDMWKMVKLRHLYTNLLIEIPRVSSDDHPFMLEDLQTIGKLDLCCLDERVLQWIPNLKKLTCSFMESLGGYTIFPKLNFLIHLEALDVSYGGFKGHLGKFPHLNEFPPNLKSLTLSNFHLSWKEMSILGRLPNLEVLKLSYEAFEGPRWDTSDGQFRKLKFLKFQRLDIKQWNASSNHFPNLQILVLDHCKQLEEIPSNLGDIFTLEMIRLWYCRSSATYSVMQIQEHHRNMGYDGLKILIHPKNNVDDIDEDDYDGDIVVKGSRRTEALRPPEARGARRGARLTEVRRKLNFF